MLTKQESNMLERVLKTALHIIYQDEYQTFKNALRMAKLKSLKERRILQITKFSRKCYTNKRFEGWFCKQDQAQTTPTRNTRSVKNIPLLKPVPCRTQRYARSSLPVMTGLLSWHHPLPYTSLDLA